MNVHSPTLRTPLRRRPQVVPASAAVSPSQPPSIPTRRAGPNQDKYDTRRREHPDAPCVPLRARSPRVDPPTPRRFKVCRPNFVRHHVQSPGAGSREPIELSCVGRIPRNNRVSLRFPGAVPDQEVLALIPIAVVKHATRPRGSTKRRRPSLVHFALLLSHSHVVTHGELTVVFQDPDRLKFVRVRHLSLHHQMPRLQPHLPRVLIRPPRHAPVRLVRPPHDHRPPRAPHQRSQHQRSQRHRQNPPRKSNPKAHHNTHNVRTPQSPQVPAEDVN
jgi:hypothetical protein